jgi:hypothetical protein
MKRQSLKSQVSSQSGAEPDHGAIAGNETAFTLSRVYAEGWNAAKKLTATECDALDAASMATLNPYAAGAKQQRWGDGFAKALGR